MTPPDKIFITGKTHIWTRDKVHEDDIEYVRADLKQKKRKRKTNFTPPTLREVQEYIKAKGYSIDAQAFIDYFEEGNWVDSKGNKVRNWKQKIITWAGHRGEASTACIIDKNKGHKYQLDANSKKVYLCKDCFEVFTLYANGQNWANMTKTDLEKIILAQRASLSKREKPKSEPKSMQGYIQALPKDKLLVEYALANKVKKKLIEVFRPEISEWIKEK